MFKKTIITTAILSALSATAVSQSAYAYADEEDAKKVDIEVISVTGIRGGLQRAMDFKKDSDGIVDAISAEDIGKFPDTNLAESLQVV
jgi:hypothetical protein